MASGGRRRRALCYAQSGGVTSVINATAAQVVSTAKKLRLPGILGACNGIIGVLEEEFIDLKRESASTIRLLAQTPGGALGSCRYQLPSPDDDLGVFRRLADVFAAHDIGYLLYNGGNDSQDTTAKIAEGTRRLGHEIVCIGIPKTVDNDLVGMDCCPGFGSAAKYVAVSTAETALDLRSMARTSTKVLVVEVMGRNAGWIAAASGLAFSPGAPQLILFPEIPFESELFLAALDRKVKRHGHCVVVASEGARHADGTLLAASKAKDAYGHVQLGGVAPKLAHLIGQALGHKVHWAVADYLQRAARHIASLTDYEHARELGDHAVRMAVAGETGMMPVVRRISDRPYKWEIAKTPASEIANRERRIPRSYITRDGYHITEPCRRYLQPLIVGEAPVKYRDGLPVHVSLKEERIKRRLPRRSA